MRHPVPQTQEQALTLALYLGLMAPDDATGQDKKRQPVYAGQLVSRPRAVK
jgi:hypothetical protein